MVRGTVLAAALLAAAALAGRASASPEQDYVLYCMGCHGETAQGVPGKIPPLATTLARFMRTSAGRDYLLRVPGAANSALPDAQLAAVLNWLSERYPVPGASPPAPFSTEEVARVRHTPLADVHAARRAAVRAATGAAPAEEY